MSRTIAHPVTSRIRSSRRFSRNTASLGSSPSASILPYLTFPSNSPRSRCSGQPKSATPTRPPRPSYTSNCSMGAGSPWAQNRYLDRDSPGDSAGPSASATTMCTFRVFGQRSMRPNAPPIRPSSTTPRCSASSAETSPDSTVVSEAVSMTDRAAFIVGMPSRSTTSPSVPSPSWWTTSFSMRPVPPSRRVTWTRDRSRPHTAMPCSRTALAWLSATRSPWERITARLRMRCRPISSSASQMSRNV